MLIDDEEVGDLGTSFDALEESAKDGTIFHSLGSSLSSGGNVSLQILQGILEHLQIWKSGMASVTKKRELATVMAPVLHLLAVLQSPFASLLHQT